MDQHSEAIDIINAEISELEKQLSESHQNESLIIRKNALRKSAHLLEQMSKYEVSPKAKIEVLRFPQNSGHFSEFRLMDDHETEDQMQWTELEIEGSSIRAIVGDIIILNSEKV